MPKKMEKGLSPDVVVKVMDIFLKKSWEIEDDDANQLSLFNRYCQTLSDFDADQQALILELTDRFIWVRFEHYMEHIKNILTSIGTDTTIDLSKITNIYIAPLIAPADIGKTKSSTAVQYLLRGIINYNKYFASKNFIYIEGLEVNKEFFENENSLLFLVDDFIGTGETACSALEYIITQKNIDKRRIVVLTIAALQQGVTEIRNQDINIYYSLLLNKGITDYYSHEVMREKLELMNKIETKIKAHRKERLGYEKSEALITLIRTPNNTFPIFWKEKKGRIAPFPRN